MADSRIASETPIPTTESLPANTSPSTVTEAQWTAMQSLLDYIYDYRSKDGSDPSKLFHRKVNKRMLPDYYDVIKEPMAMSTIKAKINTKEYRNIKDFVRDWALISFNAQVYNIPLSKAYIDAVEIRKVVNTELDKFVEEAVMTKEEAEMPYLGEIPVADDMAMVEGEMEDEELDAEGSVDEEEDEDEDDELDDSDEEGGRRKKRKSTKLGLKRMSSKYKEADEDEGDARKRRGRPPRVDTPLESRIKEILKGMRKFKSTSGSLMIYSFERLPDKSELPDYYTEVRNPIALDMIKKKLKRKKYASVDSLMVDLELMFENAKSYNTDESQVYKEAVHLQRETRKIAEEVKAKPDADYASEDGRIPMPDGILHNGELWKVGDWVHIQNANDLTKPVVAQLYRTWQDTDGNKWVNACWYYRPEQTVHRFDKFFYENEVVKTGQYRDHPIDEVVDRCFVMFFTRYNKGRPRNFPPDKEIYVCEARYNEEKHKLNKIKTWASCLPDEVRDKDYEMDLFEAPRRMKKFPSPIKYLFKEGEQKEGDALPVPVWGAPNAPPKIGAVHCRPRDPKDSPPPEPTPTPPPNPPPPAISRSASAYNSHANDTGAHRPSNINIPAASTPSATTYTPSHYNQLNPMPSPAPILQAMPASASQYRPQPLTPQPTQPTVPVQPIQYQNTFATASGPTGYRPPHVNPPSTPVAVDRSSVLPPTQQQQNRHDAKQDPEVYFLPDHANNSIPSDVRSQFQCDAYGRVLFFTSPPIEGAKALKRPRHTAKYLAWKMEREEVLREKRKRNAEDEARSRDKRAKSVELEKAVERATLAAVEQLNDQLVQATVDEYKVTFGERWKAALEQDMRALENGQERIKEIKDGRVIV